MDLIIICFLCNCSYNIYYVNEICPYYSYYTNKIIKFYKNYKLKKNLIIYSNSLLDKYYNPKSKYIEYLVNNFDNEDLNKNNKLIAYIDKLNKIKAKHEQLTKFELRFLKMLIEHPLLENVKDV